MDQLALMAAAGLTAIFGVSSDASISSQILRYLMSSSSEVQIVDNGYVPYLSTLNALDQFPGGVPNDLNAYSVPSSWRYYGSYNAYPCVASAVSAREEALMLAYSTHSYMISWARQQRAEALAAAYAQPSGTVMRQSVRDAWTAYDRSFALAQKNFVTEESGAWFRYELALRACGRGARANSDTSIAPNTVRTSGGSGAPGTSSAADIGYYSTSGESGGPGASSAETSSNSSTNGTGDTSPGTNDAGSESGSSSGSSGTGGSESAGPGF